MNMVYNKLLGVFYALSSVASFLRPGRSHRVPSEPLRTATCMFGQDFNSVKIVMPIDIYRRP